ncbi:beta-N-acetylglucosaminidase domain-containing protein [Streptomyces sp. JV176]|uniref:beta-N-acetylhexosaminidase family protein n=1 Tax=Streptomyces sp. JV176 TaxID=858630 RepID=UPI002E776CA0|nr:beta-N-acetylglucosaminidase domain-containing protein [Streptomyces sp. JV176]MEE1801171.1 beta-N-acetylglucosaminidase domain-containing protein [Streptomyces sp. JV176]
MLRRSRRHHPGQSLLGLPLLGALALATLTPLAPPAPVTAAPVGASTSSTAGASAPSDHLPVVTPTPQRMTAAGRALRVPDRVRLAVGEGADTAGLDVIREALTSAGARRIDQVPIGGAGATPADGARDPRLTVVVGSITDRAVARALRAAGGSVPGTLAAEGYSLATTAGEGRTGATAVLAGNDADGIYYAAQTFRQLAAPASRSIAAVSVTDHPLMSLRGSIEGFYGAPWSHADRLDQLAFYGAVKANTYIYAPKDDVYLRESWRDTYPAERLADLRELIDRATAHHVDFTYAISPGLSVCYSDPNDVSALENKLESLYAQGARSFYVALDDISYTNWNCPSDQAKYGAPGRAAAGRAQADLLNAVQRDFIGTHSGARPLQMVPTEYSDMADSPYKKVLREQLDPQVVVQWTGNDVVPPSISVADARAASAVWGRKVFLWDNYPVNDYGQTTGRLLMAPYDRREAGLHEELSGIVLNPMNQAAASKVALFGGASFAWNDRGYDAGRTWRAAADHLSGGDRTVTRALLAFFDTQHLAPTFGPENWQPQAPVLRAALDDFRAVWSTGSFQERRSALRELSAHTALLADAPERIRGGVADQGFLRETAPWLTALDLWGDALDATLDGLRAQLHGDSGAGAFAEAAGLARRAAEVRTIPGTTRPQGTIKVADGVLDTFIGEAPTLRD